MAHDTAKNKLFYGDNLQVLREHIADESVDLIYLDPPFNSKRDYNLLFKTPKKPAKTSVTSTSGKAVLVAEEPAVDSPYSDAQITAFDDTWHWNEVAAGEFNEILKSGNTDVAELMEALKAFLKPNDMLAYLTMMCNRLLELHRVLKPTGSLYLHCDPTASHYLKLVLDGVFGKESFRNEIVWKRTSSHNDASQGLSRLGRNHDVLFFYSKTAKPTWNLQFAPYADSYVKQHYSNVDATGRRYKTSDLTAAKPGGDVSYEWKGVFPPTGRYWAYSRANMEKFDSEGKLVYAEKSGMPRMKHFLDEMHGVPLGDTWDDIPPINSQASERMGYPTQKPVALLERIISASSNEGDVVLDPFCGCGTAVHAAEKLKRRWLGIDITHLSIGLIERRMKDAFPQLAQKGAFEVIGTPQDFGSAQKLANDDKYQFQSWACMLVGAQIYKGGKKGADGGIDGLLWIEVGKGKTEKVIVQVKGGATGGRAAIATLIGDVSREKAAIGLFITLIEPTREMVKEAAAAGHFESPHHGAFPKIQILTIEKLLSGEARPQFPDLSRGEQTFKKAKKENAVASGKQGTLI